MEFTGERVIPGQVEPDLWAEHLSRYRFAANVAKHLGRAADVLDIGCGAGYGTAVLAEGAASAIGIDFATEAIEYARANYPRPNLRFALGSATDLPFPDASFDLITAFEVIEHLADGARLLAEARRVLRSGGILLVSTPNRTYYAEARAEQGPNPFHVHEFTYEEFTNAVAVDFPAAVVLLQNHTDSFCFYDPQAALPCDAFIEAASGAPADAHFFLAVCSLKPVEHLRNFLYVPAATNLLRTRERHIGLLQNEVRALKLAIGELQADLQEAQAERDTMIAKFDELKLHLEEQNRWALRLDQELKQTSTDLTAVVTALDTAENTVVERTRWAQRLDRELNHCRELLRVIKTSYWLRLGQAFGLGPNLDATAIGEAENGGSGHNKNV